MSKTDLDMVCAFAPKAQDFADTQYDGTLGPNHARFSRQDSGKSKPEEGFTVKEVFEDNSKVAPTRLGREAIESISNQLIDHFELSIGSDLEKFVEDIYKCKIISSNDPFFTTKVSIKSAFDWSVTLSGGISNVQRRVDIARALGHYILHFDGEKPVELSYRRPTKNQDVDVRSIHESIWFAIALILPKDAFVDACSKGFEDSRLARRFVAPMDWISVRKSYLGIDTAEGPATPSQHGKSSTKGAGNTPQPN